MTVQQAHVSPANDDRDDTENGVVIVRDHDDAAATPTSLRRSNAAAQSSRLLGEVSGLHVR